MNKIIETTLAKEVIKLSSTNSLCNKDYVIYDYSNKKIEEVEAITGFEIIKELMNQGISPLIPVEFKSETRLLIEHISKETNDPKVLEYMMGLLTNKNVESLSIEIIDNIYKNSEYNSKILERFFELGFDFEQGKFNEVDKALNKVSDFFELCVLYKKDFRFNYKYEDGLCLDELLQEDMNYLISNHSSFKSEIKRGESLVTFLGSIRKKDALKESLEHSLIKKEPLNSYLKV